MSKKGLLRAGLRSRRWQLYVWEIGACLLMCALPAIIVATLYPYAGRPLPQWPLRISLNVILVVYSTILKTNIAFVTASCLGQLGWRWFTHGRPLYDFVRYDSASRGVWGSLQLLWAQRFHDPLTTLAGTILILSVFIDASLQLLVDQSNCSWPTQGVQANIPRTNLFDDTRDSLGSGDDISTTITNGIWGSGTGVDATCPTGNCTFSETYGTIGYCSSCQDSSADITIEIGCHPENVSTVPVAFPSDCPPNSTFVIESSLPREYYRSDPQHAKRLNVSYKVEISPDSEWVISEDGLEVSRIETVYNKSEKLHERIIVRVLMGMTSSSGRHLNVTTGKPLEGCENTDPVNSWRCRGYGAATCMIQPCVRIYNASVEKGKTAENKLVDTGLMTWAPDPTEGNKGLAMLDTTCLTKDQKENLIGKSYHLERDVRWSPYNATTWPDANSSLVDISMVHELLGQKCLYFIGSGFASDLVPFRLSGELTGAVEIGGIVTFMGLHRESDFGFAGNSVLAHMYNSGNFGFERIEHTFSNISDSLTTYIRLHASGNYSEPATGQVFHFAACLVVNWFWIAFPSSVISLTVLLFFTSAYSARGQDVPVWKTFLLPWIVSLSGAPLNRDFDKMEETAKEIKSRFHTLQSPEIDISRLGSG
ncbi:hypothetical protein F4777DRAFT_563756 [Nemania sp. FL0916]|nr:hypothetical protein F4777DRAFT_563756 [Nemania sp. FL0916]